MSSLVDGPMPAAFRMAEHPPGPCMVLDTLRSFYGKKLGDWILWERTCFPMSDAHALYQARLLIEKDQEPSVLKVLQGCLAS